MEAYEKAIEDLNLILAAEPENLASLFRRGYLYLKLKEWKKAVADFNAYLAIRDDSRAAWQNLAVAHSNLKMYELAANDYTRAIQIDPKNWDLYRSREGAGEPQRLDGSRRRPEQSGRSGATENAVFLERGIAFQGLKKWKDAAEDFSKVLEADPKHKAALERRAAVYFALKEYERCIADHTQILALDPQNLASLFGRGYLYSKANEWEKSLADLNAYIAIRDDNRAAWQNRAVAHSKLKMYEHAADDYTRAIELAPDNWGNYKWRGSARAKLKDWASAAADFQKAIQLGPQEALRDVQVLYYWLAILSLNNQDPEQFAKTCADLMERFGKTDDLEIANSVVWTCSLASHVAKLDVGTARARIEESVKEKPSHPLLNTLGAAHYRAQDYQAAIETLNQGIEIQGKGGSPLDWLFLAMAHARLGDQEDAKTWLEKADAYLSGEAPVEELTRFEDLDWPQKLVVRQIHSEAKQIVGARKQ